MAKMKMGGGMGKMRKAAEERPETVSKGEGSNSIPAILDPGLTRMVTPNTIHDNMDKAKGKAKMRFIHPPLSPDQTLVGGEGIKHRAAHTPVAGNTSGAK